MRTRSFSLLALVSAIALGACGSESPFIECRDDSSCDLQEGGDCLVNPATGNQFCAYPDEECSSGMRWSELDVETSIAGDCVSETPIDAGIDANDFDAMPPDAGVPEADFARQYGAFGADDLTSINVNSSGFVFGGFFRDDVDFGGGVIDGEGNGNMVVANFATNGAFAWARAFGGTAVDRVNDVARDAAGDVAFIGTWGGTVDFGSGPVVADNANSGDVAIGKLSASNGMPVWVRTLRSAVVKLGNGVAVDGNGDVIAVGQFSDAVDFGAGPVTPTSQQMFVAKFDGETGALVWVQQFAGPGIDAANRVIIASNNDVIVAGRFTQTANFGGGNITAAGNFDAVAFRLAGSNGAYVWATAIGSTTFDEALALSLDAAGDVYVGGTFSGTIELGAVDLTTAGDRDGFLMKLAGATGARQWVISLGGAGSDEVRGVTIGPDANPVVVGFFTNSADFGNGTVTSGGGTDVFVVSYAASNGAFGEARRIGNTDDDRGYAVARGGDMNIYVGGKFGGTVDFGTNVLTAPGGAGGQSDMFIMRYQP